MIRSLTALTFLVAAVSLAMGQATLPFTQIDCPGGLWTEANGINNSGEIVGFCVDASGTHGFHLKGSWFSLQDVSGSTATVATSISSNGAIVGSWYDTNNQLHGFRLKGKALRTLDAPHGLGSNTSLFSINDNGDIAGTFVDPAGHLHSFYLLQPGAFRRIVFPGSVLTSIEGVNNSGDMVGYYESADITFHAFNLHAGVFNTIDVTATIPYSYSINNLGQVAGLYEDGLFQSHIFVVTNGVIQIYDLEGGTLTVLHYERVGINDLGQIVGSYQDTAGMVHGFLAQIPGSY